MRGRSREPHSAALATRPWERFTAPPTRTTTTAFYPDVGDSSQMRGTIGLYYT